MDDERQHLSELLQIYHRRLRTLEKQAATLGIHAPPHVQAEIEDIQAAIARLELDLHQPTPGRPILPSQIASTTSSVAHPSIQAPQPTNNLPVPLTTLIGREREAAAACMLLRQPNIRLLTLIGPPGVGKTRLGLQVAAELRDSFADGVVFVALEPLRNPNLVISTIAQALSVRETGSQPLVESLKAYLRDKQLLLLLDNCEQLVSASPRVADILATAPRLKVLATSRAVLHLSGEHSFLVLPLSLPDSHTPASPNQLSRAASVQLFIERAQATQPNFQLTTANAAAVLAICIRLEGIPLAIELAAARIQLLTPHAMLGRLASRLTLLTGGARDLPAHQQTLRATLDWSNELLQPAEQVLFRWLAVFVGGHTLPAVEAVCNAEDDLGLDVLDGLQSLLDKSLLYQREDSNSEPRFMMLETLREYALEQLEISGEAEEARRRHADYYLALAETAEPELWGEQQVIWLNRLEVEHDNLRAVLTWSQATVNIEVGMQLAAALWWFWHLRGYLSEGRAWLERMLVQSSSMAPLLRATALNRAGWLAHEQGDDTQAQVLCEHSLTLFRKLNDKQGSAWALSFLSGIAYGQHNFEQAVALSEEGLTLFRELSNKKGSAFALGMLGVSARARGEVIQAMAFFEESLALFRELGDRQGSAFVLTQIAWLAHKQGDDTRAHLLLKEGLMLRRELGDKRGSAFLLNSLGEVARSQGDYPQARTYYDASLALFREQGDRRASNWTLHNLGYVELQQGDNGQAGACFAESLVLSREFGDIEAIAASLAGLALIPFKYGRAHSDEAPR